MSKHIVVDARIRRSSTGRYADRLIERLQDVDKENRYTILVEPDDIWKPTSPNFTVQPCKYAQFSFNPFDQIGFALQLKRLKPDLVHFTMTQQPVFYFGNIVTTTHDLTMLEYARAGRFPQWLHQIRMAMYRFLIWWSHKKSHKIIVPTEYVKQDVAKYHPFTANKLIVTLEASEPPLDVKSEKPAKAQKPYLLYVGRAFPHKNLETLVKAFENLISSQPELFLVLAGKKEHYYEQLEDFASHSPARNNIIFTGFVSDAELKWLYENAVAYVFPSLSEGFGLPGLEAMAHSCPVISSSATCLPEVYKDAALYFDPTDPADLSEKIRAIIDQPKLAEDLIAKGKEVLKQYSWEKMATETLAVYKSLLNKSS
jgi:glycosyltransferase involved in cell wall biosynthesis